MVSTASLTDRLKKKLDTETEGSNDVMMAWSSSTLNAVLIKDPLGQAIQKKEKGFMMYSSATNIDFSGVLKALDWVFVHRRRIFNSPYFMLKPPIAPSSGNKTAPSF